MFMSKNCITNRSKFSSELQGAINSSFTVTNFNAGTCNRRSLAESTFKTTFQWFLFCPISSYGLGSVVGIATGHGLDGPGIESRWGRDFPHLFTPTLGPPSLLYNKYWVFPRGEEWPGCDADPSPPSSTVVKKGYSYTSTPPMGCTACTRVHFTSSSCLPGMWDPHEHNRVTLFFSKQLLYFNSWWYWQIKFFQSLHKVSQVFRLWFIANNKGKKRIT
jgi:hypothetical protein